MKQFWKLKVLPILLVVSLMLPFCVVPAAAVEFPELATIRPEAIYDYDLLQSELKRLMNDKDSDNCAFVANSYYLANPNNWTAVSRDTLSAIAVFWNYTYQDEFSITAQVVDTTLEDGTKLSFIRAHLKDSVYEGRDALQWCLTDGAYNVLVSPIEDNDESLGGVWIPEDSFHSPYRYLSYEELYNLAYDLRADVAYTDTHYYILREDGQLVYADIGGLPYAALKNKSEHASQTDRPVVDDPEDEVDDEFNAKIDLDDGTIVLPDGLNAFIDSVLYDEGNKTYYVDCFDEENNYYYYSFTYHINYTSITYIGTTEEYQKYEIAYELPDGRSSADLTKEDLEQLNLNVDVIPYVRSTDNTTVRSLYHFDGDTNDDSFWNYCTDFVWNDGASLTYMDVGVFEGALYLDENAHDFDFVLPSGMGSGDFTLQWRMYPSHTLAPQTDSYVQLGDVQAAYFDGAQLYNGKSVALDNYSTGIWNEFALVRNAGTIYYYINGLCVGSWANVTAFDTIKFFFGDDQQTFKYFDELRVLNYAIQEGGASYEPTAVPHGTNLALALPNEAIPVADEFYEFTHTDGYVDFVDFSTGSKPDALNYTTGTVQIGAASARFPNWVYSKAESYLDYSERFVTISEGYLATRVASRSDGDYSYSLADGDYTVSVVFADGSVYSHTFQPDLTSETVFDWGTLGLARTGTTSSSFNYFIKIAPTTAIDLVGIEIAPGTKSDFSAELVSSVIAMPVDQMGTPTLAVKTDIEFGDKYQLGGVRPSVPEKGQVWAMIENQRIVSLQVYNGQAWEAVEGRIWTGERWIPPSSYNIITLQDMYDIVDATPDFEYIYSESGFWAWWQKSWNAFTERLFIALGSGGAGAGGGAGADGLNGVDLDAEDPVLIPEEEDGKTFWEFILLLIVGGKSVVSGVREITSGAVSSVPESMDDIVSAFDSGGLAVGVLDGSSMDPDAADLPQDDSGDAVLAEVEEVDPWRYR